MRLYNWFIVKLRPLINIPSNQTQSKRSEKILTIILTPTRNNKKWKNHCQFFFFFLLIHKAKERKVNISQGGTKRPFLLAWWHTCDHPTLCPHKNWIYSTKNPKELCWYARFSQCFKIQTYQLETWFRVQIDSKYVS